MTCTLAGMMSSFSETLFPDPGKSGPTGTHFLFLGNIDRHLGSRQVLGKRLSFGLLTGVGGNSELLFYRCFLRSHFGFIEKQELDVRFTITDDRFEQLKIIG